MAAEMVIRLVDGSSDSSSSLSPANELPNSHNPDIPTVASSRTNRDTNALSTTESDPKASQQSALGTSDQRTGSQSPGAISVDSMEEFTKRIEAAIQDWARKVRPASDTKPKDYSVSRQKSVSQEILDAIEQSLPRRAANALNKVRRSKIWASPTVQKLTRKAKSVIARVTRKVGATRIGRRLGIDRIAKGIRRSGRSVTTSEKNARIAKQSDVKSDPSTTEQPRPKSTNVPASQTRNDVGDPNEALIKTIDEFSRKLETLIQEWAKTRQPSEQSHPEGLQVQQKSTAQQVLDSVEQRLPKRGRSVFNRIRNAKIWSNPTIRRLASGAKSAASGIARKVRSSRLVRRLAATKMGRAVRARGSALLTRAATSLGVRGAATGAVSAAGSTGAAAGGAAAGAGGAAAGSAGASAGGAAVAGVAGATAVAIPVAATVAAFVALVGATYSLHRTFKSTADDLEGFSGQISAARARAQANTTINMVERARAVGPQLGRLENANTRFQDSTEKLWTAILQVLLKFEPAITKVVDGLTVGVDYGAKIIAQLEVVKAAITVLDKSDDKAAAQNLAEATKRLNDSMAVFVGGLPPTNNNFFDEQLKAFLQQNLPDNKWQNPPPMGGGMF